MCISDTRQRIVLPHSLLPSLRREGAAETATVRKRSDALVKYYGLAKEVFIFYVILLEQMQSFLALIVSPLLFLRGILRA